MDDLYDYEEEGAELRQLLEPVEIPLSPLDSGNRLTFRCSVYQEQKGENPFSIVIRYSEILEEQEEPYSRRFKVQEAWRPLADAWRGQVETVGLVVVENRSKQPVVRPTPEEAELLKQTYVQLGTGDSDPPSVFGIVRPGRVAIWQPEDVEGLLVRSTRGESILAVTVLSR